MIIDNPVLEKVHKWCKELGDLKIASMKLSKFFFGSMQLLLNFLHQGMNIRGDYTLEAFQSSSHNHVLSGNPIQT